jgi:GT2 family glycosyltransferase
MLKGDDDVKLSFLVVVVLYQCEIGKSETINSLIGCMHLLHSKSKIIVWDNSPIPQNESNLSQVNGLFENFHYHHTGENVSLAVVYNQVINDYGSGVEYVNIWDQDSVFSADYFTSFAKSLIEFNDLCVFVPKVFNGRNLESPGHYYYFKGKKWRNMDFSGAVSSRHNVAIMSGILVKRDLFNVIRFDERLRFYGIDTKFFLDLSKIVTKIFVMDYVLVHNLSMHNHEEALKIKLFRFQEFCYSSLIICRGQNFFVLILGVAYLMYHTLRLVIQNRRFQYVYSFFFALKDFFKTI